MRLTTGALDAALKKRPHKQPVIRDGGKDGQPGLCVLISRGPKGGQAMVTLRVAFYLKNLPGKPFNCCDRSDSMPE